MSKCTFLRNALCLTASAFVVRCINIGYRIYLTEKIGAEGMGLYQLIYAVFVFAITVSTAGISLSVTRIVSAAIADNKQKSLSGCVRKCILFSLCLSIASGIALYFTAPAIGNGIVGDDRVIRSLQILSFGLPFMAACACLKGYFLAVRGVIQSACGELLEQFVTISVAVGLFVLLAPNTVELCCCMIMIGSTVGEVGAFFFTFLLYRIHVRKTGSYGVPSNHILKQICRIVLPITISTTLRSGLSVVENLLIPIGYRKNGATASSALAEYGILNGMVLPVLLFPATFLQSFASLLVPEMTESLTKHHVKHIRYVSGRAIRATLLFSFFMAFFCGCFASQIGGALYHRAESVRLLQILSPLIPLLYLDMVVDSLLKGLDQQLPSLRYNFADTAIRVVLVFFLIPIAGTKGYLCIVFFSAIFNGVLSIHRLLKTADLSIDVLHWVVLPALCSGSAVGISAFLVSHTPMIQNSLWLALSLGLLLSLCCYLLFLRLCRCVSREDTVWLKQWILGMKKDSPFELSI